MKSAERSENAGLNFSVFAPKSERVRQRGLNADTLSAQSSIEEETRANTGGRSGRALRCGSGQRTASRARDIGNGSIRVPEGKVFYREWSSSEVERTFLEGEWGQKLEVES